MRGMKTHKVALTGLLIALALILSYLESLVPLSFAIPGIKLGLPNLVIVFALYRLRPSPLSHQMRQKHSI